MTVHTKRTFVNKESRVDGVRTPAPYSTYHEHLIHDSGHNKRVVQPQATAIRWRERRKQILWRNAESVCLNEDLRASASPKADSDVNLGGTQATTYDLRGLTFPVHRNKLT